MWFRFNGHGDNDSYMVIEVIMMMMVVNVVTGYYIFRFPVYLWIKRDGEQFIPRKFHTYEEFKQRIRYHLRT